MAEGGVGRTLNVWIQTLAIIFAGIWGVWVFVNQEILKPAAAPINLSTQLALREAGLRPVTDGSGARLLAIELEVSASNPSTRTVHVLNNYWRATGLRIDNRAQNVEWLALANQSIRERTPSLTGASYMVSGAQVVGAGSVLPDTSLKPGESVSATYVFYVPEGQFDMIDVETVVPSARTDDIVGIDWTVSADGALTPSVYRLQSGQHQPVSEEDVQKYYDDKDISLQSSTSRRQLSLWRRGG